MSWLLGLLLWWFLASAVLTVLLMLTELLFGWPI